MVKPVSRIYVDVVFNHMCAAVSHHDVGTGGSTADTQNYDYPAVPYTKEDFHTPCSINDWDDPHEVTVITAM